MGRKNKKKKQGKTNKGNNNANNNSGGGNTNKSNKNQSNKQKNEQESTVVEVQYDDVSPVAEDERKRGNREYHKKNFAKAVRHYTKGIALAAKNPPFLVVLFANRAAAHIGLKAYDACVDDCSAAITLDPRSVKAHGRRAYAYYCMKAFKEAVQDYERALQLDPTNEQVRDNLARASTALQNQQNPQEGEGEGKSENARPLPSYDELPPLIPARYMSTDYGGVCLNRFQGGFVDLAETTTSTATSAPANVEKALREKELGNKAFLDSKFNVALEHYSRAISLNPREAVFFSNRAAVHLKLDRYYDAIGDCTKSIELKPTIKAHARRGSAWAALEEYEKAADDYRIALQFERRNQDCRAELIRCLRELATQYRESKSNSGDLAKVQDELSKLGFRENEA